ncbi:hypothetical protein ACHAP5_011919 [Fusarium lateritium]
MDQLNIHGPLRPARTTLVAGRSLELMVPISNVPIDDGSFSGSIDGYSSLSTAFLARQTRELYTDWYLGNPRGRWSNPAKNAYEAAIQTLKKELTLEECQDIWLRDKSSMEDVQCALSTALQEYQRKAKGSHVRKWLASCSSRVAYYGSQ